jgi:peptide/nickel transport system substrate-binding protein
MNKTWRKSLMAGAFAAAMLAGAPAMADKADDTLKVVWGANGPIESVDLYFSTRRTAMELSAMVWDTLVFRDPNTFEYKPLLAKAWRRLDDRTLEFDLREDVKFHDGTPFGAKDVVATLTRVSDPAFKVRVPRNVNWIDKVVEVGPHKVQVVSKAPFPPALDYIATALPIYPGEYYAKVGPEGMHKAPIGTGPYRMIQVETAKAYRLVRNDDYMKASPKGTTFIKNVDIREVPDAQTQVAELLGKRAHIIWDISSDQLDQIGRVRGFKTIQAETMRVGYIGLDAAGRTGHKALQNADVRRAVAHAVNREAIVKNLVRGSARVVDAPCYEKQFGCVTEAARKYEYSPEKAKEFLKKAGYESGVEFDLFVIPLLQSIAEVVASDLGKVGIRARIRTMEYPALHDLQSKDQTPAFLLSWGSYSVNDVSSLIGLFFLPGREDYARDPELHDWLKKAETTVDPAVRKDLYAKSIERITDRAYWLPMYTFVKNYAFSDQISFEAHADEFTRLYMIQWK